MRSGRFGTGPCADTLTTRAQRRVLETLGLAVAIGMVLADSSVVILALPEILREYDVEIPQVDVGHHVVQPRARAGRGARRAARPAPARARSARSASWSSPPPRWRCALAPSFGWLVAVRCVQAIGGAAVVCAALELLPRTTGSEARAVAAWATAGALGRRDRPGRSAALLTEAISWQAIFIAQTPAAAAGGARAARARRRRRPSARLGQRAAAARAQPRAGPDLGRADGRAVPARADADRGLADDARCRPRRPSRSCPSSPSRPAEAGPRRLAGGARGRRRRAHRRRAGRARPAARRRLGLDDRAAGAGRPRPRPGARRR